MGRRGDTGTRGDESNSPWRRNNCSRMLSEQLNSIPISGPLRFNEATQPSIQIVNTLGDPVRRSSFGKSSTCRIGEGPRQAFYEWLKRGRNSLGVQCQRAHVPARAGQQLSAAVVWTRQWFRTDSDYSETSAGAESQNLR